MKISNKSKKGLEKSMIFQRKINLFVLIVVIVAVLSMAALSQISPIIETINNINQITPTIILEEKSVCSTEFYEEVQTIYGDCIHYDNYTHCLNTSGVNTDCFPQQDKMSFSCKTGEDIFYRNRTECIPNDEFIISIDKDTAVLKKQLDFSDWGPCVYEEENNCLVVTCVSLYDGAHKGQFTDCKGGKSCQRFEICDDSIKTFYKNSREDFVEYDSSFHLPKLALGEVEK